MKKAALTLLFLTVGNSIFAQQLKTRSGEISFEATMPAIEEIAGKNSTASCILDKSNGNFASQCLVKAFKFKIPLMEEHFNENYMESTKFPKSTFSGKILNFNASKLSSTKTAYDLEGDLTIHGVTKKVKTKIYLATDGAKVMATSNFSVKPQDYKIEIPNLVKDKIAKDVKIALNFILE
jgi:polyisoprenoid-binding protein YceI